MTSKKKEKYQLIVEAALKVIAEHGYHNAQVSRIAKEAGVADGTIYLYFKNKEDILISVFREKLGELIGRFHSKDQRVPYRRGSDSAYVPNSLFGARE